MAKKIVVIGGVAGGASAAAKARREDEEAEVIVFEEGKYPSFANCGLPYYVGGTIEDRSSLLQVSPQRFDNWFGIDVRVEHQVTEIDREAKKVSVTNKQTKEEFKESYDKLIIATGARASKPPVPGIDLDKIFTLKTIPDADAIVEQLEASPTSAVVVGAGYIGIEATEELAKRGLDVTLIEMQDQILPILDKELTTPLTNHLQKKGINVLLEEKVGKFEEQEKITISLQSGQKLKTDFVVIATGAIPRLGLVEDAGLKVGKEGVVVNEWMQTSDPDIYAAGDITESKHLVTNDRINIPLAGPANKQGRIAGAHAAGRKNKEFAGVLGTNIIKVCDWTAGGTGLTEDDCKKEDINYYTVYTPKNNHAGYYPGAEKLIVKIIIEEETGRLLGGQVVGKEGVDKQIDVLATALSAQMTVEDLEDLDLAYAPPYSSAKSPTIMAGMIAADVLRGEMEIINPQDLKATLNNNEEIQLVDVRTKPEYEAGSIGDAKLIPLSDLREEVDKLDPQKRTVIYCAVGYRGYLAYKILKQNGFKEVENLTGGITAWNLL
ncbi:NAD(FAD)-dependent dehydrogenase [Halobacteroides halobius DSM 5150]|uniref:NAD(FAD)-dependent dehydrogenase n=1 Tax=Halobacteroides halobius (strain ATCC 35273 / DSM 5150 / MD-1) TaxID=748449 RepID=L0K9V2_HALHC|nr:FAD-dependent oxidoreductase [Halobacteroides halobius]AGB41159.1 NAD(FAD)-dependent dehydrogenase [Halobacteroides halobius DSM 5150]